MKRGTSAALVVGVAALACGGAPGSSAGRVARSAAELADDQHSLPANGTIGQCPGYPIPPYSIQPRADGTILTIGNICHVYQGTISAVVNGIQYTTIFPDTSRLVHGTETLAGTVAGVAGAAELSFEGARPCFPTCPATIHIVSEEGSGGLEDLELDLTAVGGAALTYSGTYSFD